MFTDVNALHKYLETKKNARDIEGSKSKRKPEKKKKIQRREESSG
jgi:hypothetical protein